MASSYPLDWPSGWPRTPASERRSFSPFQTTFEQARRDLMDELWLLKATNILLSTSVPLRNDGQLRADLANQKLEEPGVAVYFSFYGQSLVVVRDLYTSVEDNLRAITLAIAHLRGLERHGGALMMIRAFQGLAISHEAGEWKPEPAWCRILGIPNGAQKWMIEAAYKQRAKECHPDVGGSDAMMAELNVARDEALKERS